MSKQDAINEYRRTVHIYHGLPIVIAAVVIGGFMAAFLLSSNVILSGIIAGIPSVLLMWVWIRAAKKVDQWVCPNCKQSLRKKMTWVYPSKKCPTCGEINR